MLFRCRLAAQGRLAAAILGMLVATTALAVQKDEARTNRLAKETSPYLKLHAHNPVDWFPWGPEALEKAKAENKPIFLSIGYSSCFWCHVMERKVFENAEIAAYMNAHFVNIKVDREERPDLDDLYMLSLQVYLQATGAGDGGGWPLSIFLTPEGKPIAGGTYFPPEDAPGRPGFPGILKRVTEIWKSDEVKVRGSADVLAREVQRLSGPSPISVPKAPTAELPARAVKELVASRDPEFGGFGFNPGAPNRPKFPQPSKLLLLSRHAGEKSVGEALDHTLDQMARGGLYDHLAGGFHRYSTDRRWLVPHFEKMLYDNSQLAEVYALAAKRTGRADFRQVADETIAFVLRDLCDAQGGFYSALDAETNGVEGAYYVWSTDEIQKLLVNEAKLFISAYGLDQPSTFEHGHVLHRVKTDEELAKAFQSKPAEIAGRLASARQRLLDVRKQRPALLRDDKVLAAWNGQMIRSLAVCGSLLNQPAYTAAAERAALFVLSTMVTADGSLQRSFCAGQVSHRGCLDDYAFLIDGLLALHESTGDAKWLNAARRLMDRQIEQFWDDRQGGFYFTAEDSEPLIARMKDGYDSVLPSGNSVAVDVLVRLAKATGDNEYRSRADKTLAAFGPQVEQSPAGFSRMVLAAEDLSKLPRTEVVAKPSTDALVAAAPPQPKLKPAREAPAAPAAEPKFDLFAKPADTETAKHKEIKGRVYLSTDKLAPGGECKVAFVIDVAEKWHINANPPKPDYVVPVELEMESAGNITLTDVVYPQGQDFKMANQDEPVSVYEGQVIVMGTLKAPKGLKATSDELKFSLRYQACNNKECLVPKRMKISGNLPLGTGGKALNGAIFDPPK